MARVTALNVNGKRSTVDVDASVSLLSVLRDDLDLTGTSTDAAKDDAVLESSVSISAFFRHISNEGKAATNKEMRGVMRRSIILISKNL